MSIEEILATMENNSVNLMKMLELTIPKIDFENECTCKHSLSGSII
ncbi:MAG: hypothetical protein ACTSSC_04600 [Promethearchaeota archaeon]